METTPVLSHADEEKNKYRGIAMAAMRVLKQEMKLGKQVVGNKKVVCKDGTVIVCKVCYKQEAIEVYPVVTKTAFGKTKVIPGVWHIFPAVYFGKKTSIDSDFRYAFLSPLPLVSNSTENWMLTKHVPYVYEGLGHIPVDMIDGWLQPTGEPPVMYITDSNYITHDGWPTFEVFKIEEDSIPTYIAAEAVAAVRGVAGSIAPILSAGLLKLKIVPRYRATAPPLLDTWLANNTAVAVEVSCSLNIEADTVTGRTTVTDLRIELTTGLSLTSTYTPTKEAEVFAHYIWPSGEQGNGSSMLYAGNSPAQPGSYTYKHILNVGYAALDTGIANLNWCYDNTVIHIGNFYEELKNKKEYRNIDGYWGGLTLNIEHPSNFTFDGAMFFVPDDVRDIPKVPDKTYALERLRFVRH